MGVKVTDVSFSIAKTVKQGHCGFCRVIINDCIAINKIRISKTTDGFKVLLPRVDKSNKPSKEIKPIVQLLNSEVLEEVTGAVLREYDRLIQENNGFYKRKSSKQVV